MQEEFEPKEPSLNEKLQQFVDDCGFFNKAQADMIKSSMLNNQGMRSSVAIIYRLYLQDPDSNKLHVLVENLRDNMKGALE